MNTKPLDSPKIDEFAKWVPTDGTADKGLLYEDSLQWRLATTVCFIQPPNVNT